MIPILNDQDTEPELPEKVRSPGSTILIGWLMVSLLWHVLLVLWVFLFTKIIDENALKPKNVNVTWVDLQEQRRPLSRKQIVDIPNLGPDLAPDDPRYLSERNQRVEQETQAPRTRPNRWSDAMKEGDAKTKSAKGKNGQSEGASDRKGKAAKDQKAVKKDLSANGLEAPQEEKSGEGGGQTGRAETDFLPDIPIGEKTYINAEAFKHTRYYLEIKRKIELTWSPSNSLRQFGGRGISFDRGVLSTFIGVTLNGDGTLSDLQVLQASGVSPLDNEALRSFRASAPFTKAPTELLSPDGKLRFEFGFIVYGN